MSVCLLFVCVYVFGGCSAVPAPSRSKFVFECGGNLSNVIYVQIRSGCYLLLNNGFEWLLFTAEELDLLR